MSTPILIYIVEDDNDIREGLALLINESSGYKCIGTSSTAEQALIEMPILNPSVVLMDINLPGMNGIECISLLKKQLPDVQVMMLTVFDNTDEIFKSLAAGATGYLLKKTPPHRLLEAIQELAQGGSPMSGEIARKVVQVFQKPIQPSLEEAHLTAREHEILLYLSKGLLYKEIASKLFISIDTVRTHIRKIYQKLHVRTRSEAMLKLMGK
jgi:DNA-binding NarL/FixJ family response regulator